MQTKEAQGKLWSTSPQDWLQYIEPSFIPMYQKALEELRLDESISHLDAGCGSGLFLSMAAATGASIHGIDAAPGLLAISKKRQPGATLLIEDLEALPFTDGAFDVVTGFNSFQYAGSFENALLEAKRVLKPKGRLVMGIWGQEKDCEAAAVLKAVGGLLPPPPPGTPGPFALSEEGKMEAVLKIAGLRLVSKHMVSCPWLFIGEEALQKAFLCTAPCAKAVQATDERTVKETVTSASRPYRLANDVYYMRNVFILFIIEKI
ncbi:MAG TPA: class I SAM-dependent methyltransferase [Flavisolibacter sp.]|nr:class I SAM-dependent methyltransferase [Flavisolibacter sp.]